MVVDKSSTTMSQVGWEEGSKRVMKVKLKEDGDASDRNQRLFEKVPDSSESKQSNIRSSNSDEGLKMSTKLEGKRLAEVKFIFSKPPFKSLKKNNFNGNQSG